MILDESASEDTSPRPMQSHLFCSILCFGYMHNHEVAGCVSWAVLDRRRSCAAAAPSWCHSLGACGPMGQSLISSDLPAVKGQRSCFPALPTVSFQKAGAWGDAVVVLEAGRASSWLEQQGCALESILRASGSQEGSADISHPL